MNLTTGHRVNKCNLWTQATERLELIVACEPQIESLSTVQDGRQPGDLSRKGRSHPPTQQRIDGAQLDLARTDVGDAPFDHTGCFVWLDT